MSSGVGLIAFRRDAHFLHAIDDAVNADVRGKVELAVAFDEVHVALALDDRLLVFLAAGRREIGEEPDRLRRGIERIHLRAEVVPFRAEDVVDLAVARAAHAVVGVVRIGEAGVVGTGDEFLLGSLRGEPGDQNSETMRAGLTVK